MTVGAFDMLIYMRVLSKVQITVGGSQVNSWLLLFCQVNWLFDLI